jgi:hypothetical protein
MKRLFVPAVLAAFFSLGLITASAQTSARTATVGSKPAATAAKTLRVNALSSSSVDGPSTTDADGVHVSFTGGIIDRGNPLFDGTISISETINADPAPTAANAPAARGKVTGVITVGSGKGDRQATIVLEFKGMMKGNQVSGEWKVSGATGIADGLKGTGKFTGRRTREGLFLNLLGVVGKPQ